MNEALHALFTEQTEDAGNESVFVPIEEIAEAFGGNFDEDSYEALAELSDDFEIEEEGGGFFVSRNGV